MHKIEKCDDCPYKTEQRIATGDSWEVVYGWLCVHPSIPKSDYSKYEFIKSLEDWTFGSYTLGGKLIGYEKDGEQPEKVPEWCPVNKAIEEKEAQERAKKAAAEDWQAETDEGGFNE